MLLKVNRYRWKLFIILTTCLAISGLLWQWGRGAGTGTSRLKAGAPPIIETAEDGYLYEFSASTFKLLIGEDEQKNPNFKLKQGLRELDIKIKNEKPNRKNKRGLDNRIENSEDQNLQPDGTDVVVRNPEPLPSPTASDAPDGASPTPRGVPDDTVTPAPLQNLEGLDWQQSKLPNLVRPHLYPLLKGEDSPSPFRASPELASGRREWDEVFTAIGLVRQVHAQLAQAPNGTGSPITSLLSPDSSLLDGTQPSVQILNPDTQPVAGYFEQNFLLQPNLDGVLLTWQLDSTSDLPSLELDSQNLRPVKEDNSIIFQTRTNRKAFKLQNASILASAGQSQPVDLEIQQSPNSPTQTLTITPPSNWTTDPDIQWPQILSVEIVSQFHDRMLPARPARQDFRSTEDLEFVIDLDKIENPEMKQALENDELPHMMFGLIDSKAQIRRLMPRVIRRQGNQLTIALNFHNSMVVPGIFDLLIQYRDQEAYIAEQDFSWGVLALNSDQAVYQLGKLAQIDMSVLDKNGQMVCDAFIHLEIKAPGGQTTYLSTEDGSIVISDTCETLITSLPDITTTYQTAGEGDYQLTLTAITPDGSFTIYDQFAVDADAPVYVRRVGPTRIYPITVNSMQIEVYAGTYAGDISVTEPVPVDFLIESVRGPHRIEQQGNQHLITWERILTSDEPLSLNYAFDTPNQSPAIYFLGPVEIEDPNFPQKLFTEPRQWQLAIDVGPGTNTVTPTTGTTSATGQTYTFTFTASGTMDSGGFTILVPAGWSAPQGTGGTAGYTTAVGNSNATVARVLSTADATTGWSEDDSDACNSGSQLSADTTTKQEGTAAILCDNNSSTAPDGDDSFSFAFTAESWSGYSQLAAWFRSDDGMASGEIQFAYDDDAPCWGTGGNAGVVQAFADFALTADTWTYVKRTMTATRTSIVAVCIGSGLDGFDSDSIWVDDLLIGPGVPTFSGTGPWTISVRILDAADTETFTIIYGDTAGGGGSEVTNSVTAGVHTFTTQSRASDAGILDSIASQPTVTLSGPPGPNTDQVMRHGNWFNSSGVEQSFFWVD
jgi:hypothetical protein